MRTDDPLPQSLALLKGAAQIAAFLNLSERAVYRYLENGTIPATKVGKVWIASPWRLKAFFEDEQA